MRYYEIIEESLLSKAKQISKNTGLALTTVLYLIQPTGKETPPESNLKSLQVNHLCQLAQQNMRDYEDGKDDNLNPELQKDILKKVKNEIKRYCG